MSGAVVVVVDGLLPPPPPLPLPRPPRRRRFGAPVWPSPPACVCGFVSASGGAGRESPIFGRDGVGAGGAGRESPILGRYGVVAAAATSGDGRPSLGRSGRSLGRASPSADGWRAC